MDCTENIEKISNKLINVQEQNQPIEDLAEEKNSPKVCDGENSFEKLPEENTSTNDEKSSIQKESIEILKVELVAPWKDPVITKENPSPLNKGNQVIENINQKQTGSDCTLNTNEVETSEVNVQFTQERESLNRDSDGIITENATMSSSLSLLTQYHSDDDNDSVLEIPINSVEDYRNNVIEIETDCDSSDDTDSSDVEDFNKLRKTIEKRIEAVDEDEEDEDDAGDNTVKKRHNTKLRVKGEILLEDLPPIQDLKITVPEDECIEFGKVHSIVDQLVLVSALPNSILLDLETVMFLEKGQKVLGEVFDVLGQVADPLYCVRFNSNKEIKEKEINIGDLAYIAPKTQYTQYIILSNLVKLKGSDASWENDIEPPPRFLDFSDDEQEQLARRQMRNKDRPADNEDQSKRPKTIDDCPSNIRNNRNIHHKNRQTEQTNNRGIPVGHSNDNTRACYGGPHQNQQRTPNQYRSSWHSNYYPQYCPPHLTGTYGMHSAQNSPQSSQAYPPHVPMYAMPHAHNAPYPLFQPNHYGAPPMFHQHGPQLMPIRPPTLHRSFQDQYTQPPAPGNE